MKLKDIFESVTPPVNKVVNVLRNYTQEENILTSSQAAKDFLKMSKTQRHGGAESEMESLVRYLNNIETYSINSPVLAIKYYLEHIGDLTHRLGEFMRRYKEESFDEEKVYIVFSGIEFSQPKIEHASRSSFFRDWVKNEKRLFEDVPNIKEVFSAYRKSHEKIPVFNKVQYHARESAVCLGNVDLGGCHHHINTLDNMIQNGTAYVDACLYNKSKYR